jgi:hypothetical protein
MSVRHPPILNLDVLRARSSDFYAFQRARPTRQFSLALRRIHAGPAQDKLVCVISNTSDAVPSDAVMVLHSA